MGLKIRVIVGDSTGQRPPIDDRFLRRDYTTTQTRIITLEAGVKADVLDHVNELDLVYVRVNKGGPVQIYKDLSPEYWTFSDTWLAFELDSVSRIALKATVETEVYIHTASA